MPILLFLALTAGLTVGSFLNVVIGRGRRGETLGGRSRCESCKTLLRFRDLIPVASFFFLKGRCRYCNTALSWQYPLIEAGTALVFVGAAWILLTNNYNLSTNDIPGFLRISVIFSSIAAGIVIMARDLRDQIIPNGAVITVVLSGIIYRLSAAGESAATILIYHTTSSLFLAIFFALLWFFSKGKFIGLGDAKLAFATSLLIGYPNNIAAFLFSFWLGGITGTALLLSRKKKLQDQIPFGPFILVGTLLAIFFSKNFFSYIGLGELLY